MPRLPTHPGEVLAEEYLKPLRISDIIRQRRDVSADTAIRLGRFFAVDPHFWLNLQTAYDLSLAESGHDYSSVWPRRDAPARAGSQ